MSKTFTALVVALFGLLGCSSASPSSSNESSGDSGTSDDSSVASDGSSHEGGVADASAGGDSALGSDASPGDAASDASDPLAPHPPAGSTMCGHGTISPSDFATGCMAASFALDDVPQLDGGFGSAPRACSAFSIASGVWQVWCTQASAYVWARFDQLTNKGTLVDCHGLSLVWIDEGVYDTGSGGGNGAHVGTYENGSQIVGSITNMPQTGIFDVTLNNTASGGVAQLFVLGSLQDSCNMGAPGEPTVFGGFGVTWMGM